MKQWMGWLGLAALVACDPPTRLEGFSRTDSGLEFQLHAIGDPEDTLAFDRMTTVRAFVRTMNDSLLWTNTGYEVEHSFAVGNVQDHQFEEALRMLVIGDSATFLLPGPSLSSLKPGLPSELLRVTLSILSCEPQEDVAFRKTYEPLWRTFPDERKALQHFFEATDPSAIIDLNGMVVVVVNEGQGEHPSFQDDVTVTFEGFFPDGRKFDSTVDRNEAFDYTVGEQGQVLMGFDLGLRQLREGGEAYLILPSDLAFAERGSTNGVVPPGATVIYHVFLEKVTKQRNGV